MWGSTKPFCTEWSQEAPIVNNSLNNSKCSCRTLDWPHAFAISPLKRAGEKRCRGLYYTLPSDGKSQCHESMSQAARGRGWRTRFSCFGDLAGELARNYFGQIQIDPVEGVHHSSTILGENKHMFVHAYTPHVSLRWLKRTENRLARSCV